MRKRAGVTLRSAVAIIAAFALAGSSRGEDATDPEKEPRAEGTDLEGSSLPKGAFARFGTIRFRNASSAKSVHFAGPDTVFSVLPDKVLSFVDWPSGKRRFRVLLDGTAISCASPSRLGDRVFVALTDGHLTVVSVATGKKISGFMPGGGVTRSMAMSPDGRFVACAGDDGSVRILEVESGVQERALSVGSSRVVGVAWASSGTLAAVNAEGSVAVWSGTFEPAGRFQAPPGTVLIVASPKGDTVWVAGRHAGIGGWDAKSGRRTSLLETGDEETGCLALSPDGAVIVAGGSRGNLRAWETQGPKKLFTIDSRPGRVTGVAFCPDSKSFVSVGDDRQILVLDSRTGAKLEPHHGHAETVTCLELSPDGKRLATGSADRQVMVWDAGSAKLLLALPRLPDAVSALDWTPDGSQIVIGCGKQVAVCSADASATPKIFEPAAGAIRGISWLQGRGILAGGTDTMIRLLDPASGKVLAEYSGHSSMVRGVASDAQGRRFASTGADGRAAIWSQPQGKPLWLETVRGPYTCAVFSADGKRLVTGSGDACVRIWDVESGKLQLLVRGFDGEILGVALSPDGTRVAASTIGNSVRVCDTARGAEIVVFHGLGGDVRGVCWGSDPDTLYSAMFETTAIGWRIAK